MRPQGAGADQTAIRPGKSGFQHSSITITTELGGAASGQCQAAIQTDGQHQPNLGDWWGRVRRQEATTASRAAGCISS